MLERSTVSGRKGAVEAANENARVKVFLVGAENRIQEGRKWAVYAHFDCEQ